MLRWWLCFSVYTNSRSLIQGTLPLTMQFCAYILYMVWKGLFSSQGINISFLCSILFLKLELPCCYQQNYSNFQLRFEEVKYQRKPYQKYSDRKVSEVCDTEVNSLPKALKVAMCSHIFSGWSEWGCQRRASTSCLRQKHGISLGFTTTENRYWLLPILIWKENK